MSLSENGNGMVMPVGPMYGNNGFGGMGEDNEYEARMIRDAIAYIQTQNV